MNAIQKIAKNIGMSSVSQVVVAFFSFILLIYVARYLGEAEFGIYSFAVSFTALFVVFADIGISQFLIRDIARNKKLTSDYITNASFIKIILSIITFGLIAAIINLMNYPSNVINIVYLFGIYSILSSFAQLFQSIFQAFEKMEYVAILTTIEKIILICFGLLVLFWGYGLTEIAYVYVIASIINIILSFVLVLKKLAMPTIKLNLRQWKTLISSSIPFGLNGIFAVLFFRIDSVLLSFFKNDVAVGIYNAAYDPLLAFGYIISNVVVSAIYPVMSRYSVSSWESLEDFTVLSSKYMVLIGFPVAVACFVLADKFIELFYTGQFVSSVIAFQILAIFIPIRLVSNITGTLLTSINKQSIRTISVAMAAIINIILNVVFIPYLSYIGASIATVISEIFLFFIYIFFINKYYKKIEIYKQFLKPALAALLIGCLMYFFREINLFVLILITTLIYVCLLLLFKTFTDEDKYILKQILTRRGKNN